MSKMKLVLVGIVVAFVVMTFSWCVSSVVETEESYGGDYASCVEQGHESAMCKRVFEW